jgi:hypothetical protein
MNTDPTWFYESDGERVGPVDGGEILNHYRSGTLRADTLVWREGLENWIPFSASELASAGPPPVPAGAGVLSPAPPPVPALFESFVPRPAALRPGYSPQIRSSFGRAWTLMTANFWPIVGCFTLTTLILSIAGQFFIPVFFMMYPLLGGLYWYLLRQVRGQSATMEMLFEGFRRQFGPLAIVNLIVVGISMAAVILLMLVIGLGAAVFAAGNPEFKGNIENPAAVVAVFGGVFFVSFLFTIPLMILSQVGSFATILILDCGLQAKESMSLAWVAVRPFLLKFTLFMVATALLTFAGMIALYVGMFVTGAWASVALVYLYEDAFGDGPSAARSIV